MQQAVTDQQPRAQRLRFGVDVHATKAEYIQALWRSRAVPVPIQPLAPAAPITPSQAPKTSA